MDHEMVMILAYLLFAIASVIWLIARDQSKSAIRQQLSVAPALARQQKKGRKS